MKNFYLNFNISGLTVKIGQIEHFKTVEKIRGFYKVMYYFQNVKYKRSFVQKRRGTIQSRL